MCYIEVTTGNVLIESDSLLGIQAVQQGQQNLLEFGDMILLCRDLLHCNNRLVVRFVRNQANEVAHKMARIPCEVNSFLVFPSLPNHLLETILSESLVIY